MKMMKYYEKTLRSNRRGIPIPSLLVGKTVPLAIESEANDIF
jgi:hypothetical protein